MIVGDPSTLRGTYTPVTAPRGRPLRVAMVTPRYFPYMGGIETHVHEVSRRLAAEGVDVTVLTTDPAGTLPSFESVAGVEIRRLKAYPAQRDYYLVPALYGAIAHGDWDLVHCQGIHTLVPPLAMLAAARNQTPFVVTFHTGGHSSRLRTSLRQAQWRALRPLLARAEALVGVSRFETELFRRALRLPRDRFTVINNGGRLPEAEAEPVSSGGPLIVSTGRLERYKGHQRVIAALGAVRREIPAARLLVLGQGPYENELRSLACRLGLGDAVEIRAIPPGDRSAMARTLRSAGVVTLMSEYEAHPVAAMEAVALGRPLVVAETSGLSEMVERGLAQGIALDASPEALAALLVRQLRSPQAPSAVQLPTWEDCTGSLLALYRAVVENPRCAS